MQRPWVIREERKRGSVGVGERFLMSRHARKSRSQVKKGRRRTPAWPAVAHDVDARCAFGPTFFLTQLRAFVRGRCPDAAESLPAVELHLHSGDRLDICHVIGLAPLCVAVAVHNDESPDAPTMRTEIVPYELIMQVTIRAVRPAAPHLGFDPAHAPTLIRHDPLMTPEETLRAAAMGRSPSSDKSAR